MSSGVITQADRLGNHCADNLATSGAQQHTLDANEVRRIRASTVITKSVQSLMCDIVFARNSARARNHDGSSEYEDLVETIASDDEQGDAESVDSSDDITIVGESLTIDSESSSPEVIAINLPV